MTFSIVAIDGESGCCGSAVASFSLAVGGTVSYSRMGVGVINTQHYAHLALGQRILEEMDQGHSPHDALEGALRRDSQGESRQLLAIDAKGRKSAWTGRDCAVANRHVFGEGCVAAGNFLVAEEVVDRMVEAFEVTAGKPLWDRLWHSLRAGDLEGGDRRGRKSAAISVIPPKSDEAAINIDLRVDAHEDPIAQLSKLRELFRLEFKQ